MFICFSSGSMWTCSAVLGPTQILLSILTLATIATPVMWLLTPSSMAAGALRRGTTAVRSPPALPSACSSQSPGTATRSAGPVLTYSVSLVLWSRLEKQPSQSRVCFGNMTRRTTRFYRVFSWNFKQRKVSSIYSKVSRWKDIYKIIRNV